MKNIVKFNDFKISEGSVYKDTKKPYNTKPWDPDKKADFRKKIKDHVGSQGFTTKQVGNDLEILKDKELIAQVMFRDDYVGIKKKGAKFIDELHYTELGKIKQKITSVIKDKKD